MGLLSMADRLMPINRNPAMFPVIKILVHRVCGPNPTTEICAFLAAATNPSETRANFVENDDCSMIT